MNKVFYSSIFGELTKQVQIRIDAASELRKRLFDQNIYERFLDWDTPTVGLNFEELIGSYNLSVAAATLDSKVRSLSWNRGTGNDQAEGINPPDVLFDAYRRVS